jgi:elongation factor P--beta-lysine ligase
MKTYDLIVIDILGNKINESLERENNLPANQNARLSETKHPENEANMLIYLLSLILSLIIQKERSLLLLDFPEQDATLQANSPVLESLPETS